MLTINNAISSPPVNPLINPPTVSGSSNQEQTYFHKSLNKVSSGSERLFRIGESEEVSVYAQDLAYSKQQPVLISSKCQQTSETSALCKVQNSDPLCTVIKEQVCDNPSSRMAESIHVSEDVCNQLRSICNN